MHYFVNGMRRFLAKCAGCVAFIAFLLMHLVILDRAIAADGLGSAPFIFDVRINLPLEPDEPTYHDFYINAGPEVGFKRGMYLTVVRPIPVHDPVQNKQQGTLNINVARLQVIHVERGITVARLQSEFTDEERPTLEFESVMIGDRIDVTSATMDVPNSKKRVRSAPFKSSAVAREKESRSDESAKSESPPVQAQPPALAPLPGPAQVPVPQPANQGPAKTSSPTQSTSSQLPIPLLAGW